VICGGLGIEYFCVLREWGAFWAIDGLLGPVLSVSPGSGTRVLVFDRDFSMRIVLGKGFVSLGANLVCTADFKYGKTVDISNEKVYAWIQ